MFTHCFILPEINGYLIIFINITQGMSGGGYQDIPHRAAVRSIQWLGNPPPFLECLDVRSRERKPFSFLTFLGEPRMPVFFNTRGIISLYVMDRFEFLGKLKSYFTFSAHGIKCFPNLVLSARTVLDEIDKAKLRIL